MTGAGIATLISLRLPPVMVAIAAAPLLGERPGLVTILSLIAAISGTAMLVVSDMDTTGHLRLAGILMAVLAAPVYTGATSPAATAAPAPRFLPPPSYFFTAALMLLPVVAVSGGFRWIRWVRCNG